MEITNTTTPEEIGTYVKDNITSLSALQIADLIEQYDKTNKVR